jgi:sortase A
MARLRLLLATIFVSVGVVLLGIFGWKYWADNVLTSQTAQVDASTLDQTWKQDAGSLTNSDVPYIVETPKPYAVFARVLVPRLGADWVRVVAEGTPTTQVLDKGRLGHYEGTSMPGQVGTFAVAGHRMTHGASFTDLDQMRKGDKVYVETVDGWYTYEFQYEKVVYPSQKEAVAPVPFHPEAVPVERYMVMTTCTPKWTARQRIVAVATFVGFSAGRDNVPQEIAAAVAKIDK